MAHMLQDKFQPPFLYANPLVHNIQARQPTRTSHSKRRIFKSIILCTNFISHPGTCKRRRTLDRIFGMPTGASPLLLHYWYDTPEMWQAQFVLMLLGLLPVLVHSKQQTIHPDECPWVVIRDSEILSALIAFGVWTLRSFLLPLVTLSYCPFTSKFLFPLLSGIPSVHPHITLLGLPKCPKYLEKVPAVPSKSSTFSKHNLYPQLSSLPSEGRCCTSSFPGSSVLRLPQWSLDLTSCTIFGSFLYHSFPCVAGWIAQISSQKYSL